MNLTSFKLEYIIFGGLGFLLLVSILTSDFQDPTFFNQLYPSIGIKNWIGLIGALIGGSLLEIFGPSTLLIPWIIARIALQYPRKVSVFISFYYSLVIVFVLSILHESALNFGLLNKNQTEFLWQNGFAGKLGLIWLEDSFDLNLGLFVLILILSLSIFRIFHVLSPVPLFYGIFNFFKDLIKLFFSKSNSIQSTETQNDMGLPMYKNHSKVLENDSEYKIPN